MRINPLIKPIYLATAIGLLFSSALLTLACFNSINTQERQFLSETARLKEQVALNIRKAHETLDNITSLFKASEYVDSDEFDALAEDALHRHPVIDSVMFLPHIALEERRAFEAFMQDSGFVTYKIHGNHNGQEKLHYEPEYYFPVKYIIPLTPSHATLIGEDFLSISALAPYIEQAITSGRTIATMIRKSTEEPPQFLMLKALYAGNSSPNSKYSPHELVNGMIIVRVNLNALKKVIQNSNNITIDIHLHPTPKDQPDAQEISVLSSVKQQQSEATEHWKLHSINTEEAIDIGNSQLSINMQKTLSWHDLDITLLTLTLLTGLVITVLLIMTVRSTQARNRELHERNEMIAKQVQEKTRELQQLSQAVESAGESIIISNHEGLIEYVNPAFSKIMGYEAAEVIGQKTSILKSGQHDQAFYTDMWNRILSGDTWSGSLLDQHKNGSFIPTYMSISPIQNEQGKITHFVAIQQDMTELKHAEQKFRQSQKMESIGTLVGGIAHDFNNMMAAILGNIFLAQKNIDQPDIVEEKLANIKAVGDRAADMVKQLLSFARKDMLVMENLDLTALIQNAFDLAQVGIQENIDTSCDITSEPLIIQGDATQLQQIIMNLMNNARDAVEAKKSPYIKVSLDHYHPEAWFLAKYPEAVSRDYGRITVSDNGCGLPKGIMDKVFEPFFTTKAVGKGTGLGLSMVYGSIQTHNGMIEVNSRENISTSFNIYLPIAQQAEVSSPLKNSELETGKGETILLVDDEDYLRETIKEVFSSIGYTVISASNGEEAVGLFRAKASDIDIVILDVVMPVMGGIEAATIIQGLKHDVPFVFMTGYSSQNPLEQQGFRNASLIRKPSDIQLLSREIRDALESTSP